MFLKNLIQTCKVYLHRVSNTLYLYYWKCLSSGGMQACLAIEFFQNSRLPNSIRLVGNNDYGRLVMTLELVIALVTCVATVAGTVITLLTFLRQKDKE